MANEKRLIDANQFKGKHEVAEVNGKLNSVICYADIVNAPTVDAVEVVRCKDCKYFSRDEEYNRAWCDYHTGCIETAVNGYCYHGKKTEEKRND